MIALAAYLIRCKLSALACLAMMASLLGVQGRDAQA